MMLGILLLALSGLACCADAQRAPCYECEAYKDAHPDSNPYRQIRSHCTYPCDCPNPGSIKCPPNVSVVRDGCGCCEVCARQRGESCDGNALCDPRKGLVCEFPADYPSGPGLCEVIKGLPCTVHNRTYDNGETFLLDCRTQCSCQNGTYACASLCPQEGISPRGTSCLHPRLVEVPGQCCREWMCDSATAQRPPPSCNAQYSAWSECSSRCGLGLSTRVISKDANNNTQSESYSSSESECGTPGGVEVRLCQEKPCVPEESALLPLKPQSTPFRARHHHVRKGHECKATQRPSGSVRLRVGPCISRKRFRPRSCGSCPGACCRPVATHTIRVLFACATRRGHAISEGEGSSGEEEQLVGGWGGRWLPAPPASLLSLAKPGSDLWELDFYKKSSGRQMSYSEIQESWEAPSTIQEGRNSRKRRHARGMERSETGGEDVWGIKPNLPKESRQPKRRRIDVRRGGRQGGGRGRRSVAGRRSFDWSHESASEEELVTLSVQWIEKCRCFKPCHEAPAADHERDENVEKSSEEDYDEEEDWGGDYKVTNGRGEMILHRVHREMKP